MDIRNVCQAVLTFAALSIVAAPTLVATPAMAQLRTLQGTVSYRERIALPPSAKVEVKLVDVSRADAPAITIARTSIRPKHQVPIPYELRFDSARIQASHRYGLQARVTVQNELMFTTTDHHAVFGGGKDNTDIIVRRVASKPKPAEAGLEGHWLAEDIRGGGVIDLLQTVLELANGGTVSGSGGCNRIVGKANIAGDKITFGPIASTQMLCPPAAMDQEAKFLAALKDVKGWRVDPARSKLLLLDVEGKTIVVLARK